MMRALLSAVVPMSVEESKTFLTLSGEVIDLNIVAAKGSSSSAKSIYTRLSNLKN